MGMTKKQNSHSLLEWVVSIEIRLLALNSSITICIPPVALAKAAVENISPDISVVIVDSDWDPIKDFSMATLLWYHDDILWTETLVESQT